MVAAYFAFAVLVPRYHAAWLREAVMPRIALNVVEYVIVSYLLARLVRRRQAAPDAA